MSFVKFFKSLRNSSDEKISLIGAGTELTPNTCKNCWNQVITISYSAVSYNYCLAASLSSRAITKRLYSILQYFELDKFAACTTLTNIHPASSPRVKTP